jgi:hypothetical protein
LRHSPFSDNHLSSRHQRTRRTLPPDAEGSHHVPRRPAVDRGASPGSPRNPHIIQSGPASICRWTRVRWTPENLRRVPDSYNGPSGTSAPHHTAAPAHGPPQTSSGSTPRLTSHLRAQGPP